MVRFHVVATVLLCLLLPANAALASVQCGHENTGGRKWSYCITRADRNPSDDVLYFFHGLGETENAWQDKDFAHDIEATWRADGVPSPTVVTISFGRVWLLSELNSSSRSGLLDVFIGSVIPTIETKIHGVKGRRLLFGESMGGFNAAQLMLWRPALFSRVALNCPAITTLSPHANFEQVSQFAKDTGAKKLLVQTMKVIAGYYFPTEHDWEASSPLNLAEMFLGPSSPPLYISCGDRDEFGFFKGAREFAQIAQARGVREVVWQEQHGGHCVYDSPAIARFLIAR